MDSIMIEDVTTNIKIKPNDNWVYKLCSWTWLYIWRKANSKELRPWNSRPKSNLAIYFWALHLIISFEDLILAFYNWVLNTIKEVIMIFFFTLINTLLLLWNVWPKKLWFKYTIALSWSILSCMHPILFSFFTTRGGHSLLY